MSSIIYEDKIKSSVYKFKLMKCTFLFLQFESLSVIREMKTTNVLNDLFIYT